MSATMKRRLASVAMVGGVAVFSTGCTTEEVNNFLNLLKIVGFFI